MNPSPFKKNDLPNFFKIPHVHFDLKKLKSDCELFAQDFVSVEMANGALASASSALAESLMRSGSYLEAALTEYRGSKQEPRPVMHSGHKGVRQRLAAKYEESPLNEHMYNLATPKFKSSYFFEELKQFKSPPTRIRMARLDAGASVDWHIDYDPSYALRLILPIITNEFVEYSVNRRGRIETIQMPANGGAWFINTGFPHKVSNQGTDARIVILISLCGLADIAAYAPDFSLEPSQKSIPLL